MYSNCNLKLEIYKRIVTLSPFAAGLGIVELPVQLRIDFLQDLADLSEQTLRHVRIGRLE